MSIKPISRKSIRMRFRLKELPALQSLFFAMPHLWRADRTATLTIITTKLLSALLTPLSVLLLGKVVLTTKELLTADTPTLLPLLPWVCCGALLGALTMLAHTAENYYSRCLSDRIALQTQMTVVRHIASLNLEQIEDRRIQDIIERAQQSPGLTLLNYSLGTLNLITVLVRIIALIGILFWSSPLGALLIVLLGIPTLIANRKLSKINFKIKKNKTTARRWTRYYTRMLTARGILPTVISLGLTDLFLDRFRQTTEDINLDRQRFYRLRVLISLCLTLLSSMALAAAVFLFLHDTSIGAIHFGKLTAFWVAFGRCLNSLSNLGSFFFNLSESEFNIINLRELLSLNNDHPPFGTHTPISPLGGIEIKNLSFTYRGTDRPVIDNLSMSIRAGETIAIVGPNGSGKTTLAKLIAQFYCPTSGEILIGNHAARDYSAAEWFRNIAVVSQTPVQFEASAEENIAFGDWEPLHNNLEAVRTIAMRTGVNDMIEQMPEGYNTQLGRMFGDYDISGGQRQKLALARALACDPSIIILDEPTAALDIHTEYDLYSRMKELTNNKTTLLISHRFSTVRMADRIFVLNEGRITERGTHNELLELNGTYSAMCRMYEQTAFQ
jgi:ATP-binding cassette subfamily B protein